MKGLDNPTYLYALILSNMVAIFLLISSLKWPRLSRFLFFILFSRACYVNWKLSQLMPSVYLEYGDLTFSTVYKNFINGWFKQRTTLLVSFIALCQGFMAVSFLLKGVVYKIGCAAAILFLLSIFPLGVGSGFPSTLIGAVAIFMLYRKGNNYAWRSKKVIAS